MKNKRSLLSFCLLLVPFFCSAAVSDNKKKFIKGSISEKITIMQSLGENEALSVTLKSFDFIIENARILDKDEDLANLALASVKALPAEEKAVSLIKNTDRQLITEKIMTIFKLFKNKPLQKAVMEKLEFYTGNDNSLAVTFLNDYLSTAYKVNASADDVLEEAIVVTGKIGNEESLSIIYSIWTSKIWEKYHKSTDDALVLLSQDSFTDVIRIFSVSSIADSEHYFSLLKKSSKISQNSLCQIAENALLFAINNAEKLKASEDGAKTFAKFQMETHEVLAGQKWSHAAAVINSNMTLAKKAWDGGIISDRDFASMIKSSVNIPSSELASSLTDMLSECNGKVEKASSDDKVKMPAKSVVLALITALGELGDKTAFDTLLSVTYLSYPLEVVDEAKKSLQALNW